MLKNYLAVIAAAGLAVAPIAAQANTRADTAGIPLQSAAASMPVADQLDEDDDDSGFLLVLLSVLIAAGIAFVVIGDTSEDDASPGTGG